MSIDLQPLSSPDNPAATPEEEIVLGPLTAPWRTNELLPPQVGVNQGKKTLILDLDETLVHSSFVPTEHCDITLTVDIEGTLRTIYVAKRPHVDEFLLQCGELYEVVVFTASLAKYAGPLLDLLDTHKVIDHRLFRESCTSYGGIFVKDLFRMGRPLTHLIIIDNSPHSYIFNPENALPCESWFDDQSNNQLLDLLVVLKRLADPKVDNVIKDLKRATTSGPFEEEVGERPTAQDSVSQDDSENEEVTASVESENEGGGDGFEDGGKNGSWNA
jgi:Dullard-like phosphatase family protein